MKDSFRFDNKMYPNVSLYLRDDGLYMAVRRNVSSRLRHELSPNIRTGTRYCVYELTKKIEYLNRAGFAQVYETLSHRIASNVKDAEAFVRQKLDM